MLWDQSRLSPERYLPLFQIPKKQYQQISLLLFELGEYRGLGRMCIYRKMGNCKLFPTHFGSTGLFRFCSIAGIHLNHLYFHHHKFLPAPAKKFHFRKDFIFHIQMFYQLCFYRSIYRQSYKMYTHRSAFPSQYRIPR